MSLHPAFSGNVATFVATNSIYRIFSDFQSRQKYCLIKTKSTQNRSFKCLMLELLSRFELETSSLPTDTPPSKRLHSALWGHFCSGKAEAIVLSAPLPPPARFLLWVRLWVRRYAFTYWRQNSLSATRSTKSYFNRVALDGTILYRLNTVRM